MPARAALAALLLILGAASPALAQETTPPCGPTDCWIPPPCPWWDCSFPETKVVVEEYRLDTEIDHQVATTRITQVLRNDGRRLAEGEFLHPIPPDATVTDVVLWIDGEPVTGEVLGAGEARRTYEEIVRKVIDPALVEFADHGLIRAEVFPIPAGETRRIEIEYTQVLEADGGLVRYAHPFAREHARQGAIERLVARIEVRTGAGLKAVYSPTHAVGIDRLDDGTAVIGFEATDEIPSSDLTLYYSTSEDLIALDVLSHRSEGAGTFALIASPGITGEIAAKDVVLVIDVSGSMEGQKIDQARRAAGFVLESLNPEDRFDVISFSTGAESFGGRLRPTADAAEATRWVDGLTAGGSTNIDAALRLAFHRSDGRPLFLLFLTDGLPTEGVVDTATILSNAGAAAPDNASVFAFGVGFDVDTILLDSLTGAHHGRTTYVTPDEPIDEAVAALYRKVGSPVMTDVVLEIDGVDVFDLEPVVLPDVFSGEQLVVAGRYRRGGLAEVRISGSVRGEPTEFEFTGMRFNTAGGPDSLPRVWAGRRIGRLLQQVRIEGPDEETIDQIVALSIRYGIVTPYTSYLVTEDAPFGADAQRDIGAAAYDRAATTIAPTSGEAAVDAADTAGDLATSATALGTDDRYRDLVAIAGERAFRLSEGLWTDTAYDPDAMTPLRVPFLSEAYFALAASDPGVASALAIDERVLVVVGDTAYEVVGTDAAGDPIAVPDPPDEVIEDPGTASTSSATTGVTIPETISEPFAAGPSDEPSSDFPLASLIAGVAGIFGLLGAGAILSRRR